MTLGIEPPRHGRLRDTADGEAVGRHPHARAVLLLRRDRLLEGAGDDVVEPLVDLVLPDVLANAGGVVVSYFEWVQGLQEYFWKEEEVNKRLDDIVTRAFEETIATRKQHGTSMRMAAYGLAVRRVAEATVTRGLYP